MGGDRRDRCAELSTLPPGFRFRPTDEELLTHYLARKAADAGFVPAAVREVDPYKAEPWDLLPAGGEDGCRYFFCARSVKFPSGLRTNRATRAGYWKSTGRDKVVLRHGGSDGDCPLGVKKTLVFYRGRAPRGDKTSWGMHEYRLVQRHAFSPAFAGGGEQSEWVICRMFVKKSPGETSQEPEATVPRPHLDENPSFDGKTPAASGCKHANSCFSKADIMAPGDHETYEGLLQLINHEELLMNCPVSDLSAWASPQATLLNEEMAANSSFDLLPAAARLRGPSLSSRLLSPNCFQVDDLCTISISASVVI